jgi:hypothetical protein
MAKLSTFNDKNEGVGNVLSLQEEPLFRVTVLEQKAIEKYHLLTLENYYVTCWTTEPDKIAMWSLYSPDKLSIRVGTTVGKLNDALHKAHEFNSWGKAIDEPGTRKRITWHCSVQTVDYVDYFSLRDKIRSRFKSMEEQMSAKVKTNKNYFDKNNGEFYAEYANFQKERVQKREGLFLKDVAYSHEHEVRGVLCSGVRNNMSFIDWKESDDPMKNLWEWAMPGELDDFFYVEVAQDFLDSVCFDPRLPKYKLDVLQALFSSISNKIIESKAFGYVFTQDDFTSDYNGNLK